MRRWWTLAIVAAVMVGDHPTDGAQGPAFRGSVDVVTLSVTVFDGARHYVTDLGRPDFLVLEDGRKQELTFFQKTGLPLALALLLDTSASMDQSLPIAQEAAIGFVRELGPADVASVIDFDSRVQVREAFTADRGSVERAIRQTTAGGSTSLYNAVYIALKELNKTIRDEPTTDLRRRAIVLLSDGEDTSSLVAFEEVLDLAARSDTAIYAIGLFGRPTPGIKRPEDGQFVLRRLAQQTGGRAFFPVDAKELAGIYGEIKAELASQYSLAYESNNPRRDGQFRRIAVRVERSGAVARARPGYYAPAK
jgi:Ca-activated chloride channel family protein